MFGQFAEQDRFQRSAAGQPVLDTDGAVDTLTGGVLPYKGPDMVG
jgi:hypothetical protein